MSTPHTPSKLPKPSSTKVCVRRTHIAIRTGVRAGLDCKKISKVDP